MFKVLRMYKNIYKYMVRNNSLVFNCIKTGDLPRKPSVYLKIVPSCRLCSALTLLNAKTRLHSAFSAAAPLLGLSILSWLGFNDDDKDKESELIMTIKRAILSTQRQEYKLAEQLLHIALRLAQQQQHSDGILYCYDLMANLAMDRCELDKAEKLFVSVLQMMLGKGVSQDDVKVIHISLKLARINHLKAEEVKAELGYKWCLDKIENQKDLSVEHRILHGIIQDWYAQFLLDRGDIEKSLVYLKNAYNICVDMIGRSEETMLLLNDLGITMWRAGNIENAQEYLLEAVSVGNKIEDKSHVGVVFANLGLIYVEKGITEEAQKCCKIALHLGKKHDNVETVEHANYCFEQIKNIFSK